MRAGGYKPVKPQAIENAHFSDKVWFHPKSGHVVSDVKPDNFKADSKSRIIPIDLIVQYAPPGSDLRRMMERNV
jgi:hypothetical protein